MKDIILSEGQKGIIKGKVCPYCKNKTQYVDSKIVYGSSYGMIYYCAPCKAWVGVHKGTEQALGRLANAELRELKKDAHFYFDKIWELKFLKRKETYKWLSEQLDIPVWFTHIGMFNEKTCKDVVYFSKQILNDLRRLDLDCGDEPKTPYYEF